MAAVATIGGAARRQSRKYLFTCRLRKFIANRRRYQLSLCFRNTTQHISSLRLEFSILSNKNASAAPHIPSAVSAHRSLDAPPRQDRSRAALRLQRQPSARPTGGRAGLPSESQHSAVGASTARALVGDILGSQGGTSGSSGHHWRCCSAPKSEIFIYVSPEEVYRK